MIPGSEAWGEDSDSMVFFGADGASQTIPTPKGDQRQYYISVRDALLGKIANPVHPVEALAVMAVLEAAVTSSETGSTQTLALPAYDSEPFVGPCKRSAAGREDYERFFGIMRSRVLSFQK